MVVVLIDRRFLVVVDMTRSSPVIIERTPEITMQIDLKPQIVTEDIEALIRQSQYLLFVDHHGDYRSDPRQLERMSLSL